MTSNRKPFAFLLAAGAVLAAPLAFAQDTATTTTGAQTGASGTQLTWADLDSNGDGNLSRDEATAHSALAAVFDQADADSDGQLTADEYRTFAAAQSAGPTGEE
ncbi:calcium-binding protein [Lysobacteraceae bacterium NML91-0213]|nr:calcium-binding protein [Xanthomonadaceae bacterium NML91-0213]